MSEQKPPNYDQIPEDIRDCEVCGEPATQLTTDTVVEKGLPGGFIKRAPDGPVHPRCAEHRREPQERIGLIPEDERGPAPKLEKFIVNRLARYDKPSTIQNDLKEQFGERVRQEKIRSYAPGGQNFKRLSREFHKTRREYLQLAKSSIHTSEQMDWISTNEQLPTEDGEYLVVVANAEETEACGAFLTQASFEGPDADEREGLWITAEGYVVGTDEGRISHWRNLPNLPEDLGSVHDLAAAVNRRKEAKRHRDE